MTVRRLSRLLLFVLLFPIFGFVGGDVTGNTAYGVSGQHHINGTVLMRIVWILLLLCLERLGWLCLQSQRSALVAGLGRTKKRMGVLLVALVACTAATSPTDVAVWYRLLETVTVAGGAILTVQLLFRQENVNEAVVLLLRAIVGSFLLGVLVLIVVGLCDPQIAYFKGEVRGFRLGGYVYHPNTLALGAAAAIVAAIALRAVRRYSRTRTLLIAALALSTLWMTDSRSGGLAVCAGILALGTAMSTSKMKAAVRLVFWSTLTAITATAALCSASELDQLRHALAHEDRLLVYRLAISGIVAHPIVGVGYVDGVARYLAEASARTSMTYWTPPHPHNLILEVLLAFGLIGGVVFLALIGQVMLSVGKILFERQCNVAIQGLAAICLVVLVSGMVESSLAGAVKPFCHGAFWLCAVAMETARSSNSRRCAIGKASQAMGVAAEPVRYQKSIKGGSRSVDHRPRSELRGESAESA